MYSLLTISMVVAHSVKRLHKRALNQYGYVAKTCIYFPPHDFFQRRIEDREFPIHKCQKGARFSVRVTRRLASLTSNGDNDVAVSYLACGSQAFPNKVILTIFEISLLR